MKQNTKEQVLRALSDAEGFLSGQELSNLLGVSRTAVWKAMGKLKEEGYEIEAVTNKGYRLAHDQETDILNQTEIEKRLAQVNWRLEEEKFKPFLRLFARNVTSTAKGATWY